MIVKSIIDDIQETTQGELGTVFGHSIGRLRSRMLTAVSAIVKHYGNTGERALFGEAFLQQFKLFGKITKLLSFKWVEKKQQGVDHLWLTKKGFNTKEIDYKLLDGVGVYNEEINYLLIESSGYVTVRKRQYDLTNTVYLFTLFRIDDNHYKHTLEDTVKNFKHAVDSLSIMLSNNRQASIKTIKKVNVLTAHIIYDKVTLVKYSIGDDEQKWQAVEVGSAIILLKWEKKKTNDQNV